MPFDIRTLVRFLYLVISAAMFACNGSLPEAKKAKHRERADSYFSKGQYQEAILEYRNVTQLAVC